MNKTELNAVISDAVNDSELKSNEIPSIDLYVDQIINLVSEKQKSGSERFFEKQLTKTMINNYSKDGVITPVKGKKYTREQILQILTVYTMKSTLSISEIKRVLAGAYSIEGFGAEALNDFYDKYMDIKDQNREYAGKVVDGMIRGNELNIEDDEDFLIILGGVVSMSGFLKNIAQAMIDAKYPEPVESDSGEEKEKEKDKEKKKKDKEKEKDKKQKNKKSSDESVGAAELEIVDHVTDKK